MFQTILCFRHSDYATVVEQSAYTFFEHDNWTQIILKRYYRRLENIAIMWAFHREEYASWGKACGI